MKKKIAVTVFAISEESNYLDPDLIRDLVQYVDGMIVECNTAYEGSRTETQMHYQVAEDHGFTDIADFVIMDEDGSVGIPVEGGTRMTENLVGAHFPEYDVSLCCLISRGTRSRALAARSRTYPSEWLRRKENV